MQWDFEPGHSAAEFRCRHMMVTWVRGHFKNIRGFLNFNPEDPSRASVRAEIDAKAIWTGEPQRDAHLRSADFLQTHEADCSSTVRGQSIDPKEGGDMAIRRSGSTSW
jgi:polyisoprenoid-binding protein YceI